MKTNLLFLQATLFFRNLRFSLPLILIPLKLIKANIEFIILILILLLQTTMIFMNKVLTSLQSSSSMDVHASTGFDSQVVDGTSTQTSLST